MISLYLHSSPVIDSEPVLFPFCRLWNWDLEKLYVYGDSDDRLVRSRLWNHTCLPPEAPFLTIRAQVMCIHQAVEGTWRTETLWIYSAIGILRKRAYERVLWSECFFLFFLTYMGMDVMDKIAFYPSPHSGREQMAIYITKAMQLKWKQDTADTTTYSKSVFFFFSGICWKDICWKLEVPIVASRILVLTPTIRFLN